MKARYKRRAFVAAAAAVVIIPISLFSCQPVMAAFLEEEGYRDILNRQADLGRLWEIEDQMDRFSDQEVKKAFPEYQPKSLLRRMLEGNFSFDIKKVLKDLLAALFKEVYENAGIIVKLLATVLLCAVLKNLQGNFLSESVGELAFFACYALVVSTVLVSLNLALDIGREVIEKMVGFMYATVPIMFAFLASGGSITSAGIFQPVMLMVVEITASLIKNIFIPMVYLSAILAIVDNVSEKLSISRFTRFIKQVSAWSLGIILTLFVGVVSLQGSFGAAVDGVTGKAAKFAIGTFIPVAGKYLADAADAVIGCTLLLKNAAGAAAMVGIIAMCSVPLIKIIALTVLYRLTCALIEPLSDKRITACIGEIADSLALMFGIVASVAFMFLISITAIIGAGNIAAMLR